MDEYVDPVIDAVLERNVTVAANGRTTIMLGDKEVEWDNNFRMYMCSKLPNPHYGPEISGKTMIINYSVTQQGLQAQLLNVTVGHERQDRARSDECDCIHARILPAAPLAVFGLGAEELAPEDVAHNHRQTYGAETPRMRD